MTKHEKIARKAIENRLSEQTEPMSLWALSCVADQAVIAAGRKSDLFGSLYPYADLLPSGWHTIWLKAQGGSGDSLLMAVPPRWRPGSTTSQSLLLGGGRLVMA